MSDVRADFGDVTAEYRAAHSGHGLIRGVSEVVWGVGPDAVSFLDGQLSQDIAGIPEGGVARSFLLEPRGKLIALMWVLRGDDRVGMVVDVGEAEATKRRLEEFRFRVDVEFELDGRTTTEVWGTAAADTVSAAGLDTGAGWADDGTRIVALLPGRALTRALVLGDASPLDTTGVIPVGSIAQSTIRIEAGEPVMGVDVGTATIPQETGLVPEAVSFTKGCFVGQELVARIDSRGRASRRLMGIVLETNVLPPVGAAVAVGEREVGALTRVGESLHLRAPVGLAAVHRDVSGGDSVTVRWEGGEAPAAARELPLDDFTPERDTSLTSDPDHSVGGTGA